MQHLTIERNGTATTLRRAGRVRQGRRRRQAARSAHRSPRRCCPRASSVTARRSDPDYLTVLNQPFAVQLDAPTMRDLAHVKRPVPFDFPVADDRGAAARHPAPAARRDGRRARAMGIAFDANGPLHGALPDRPAMALAGTITMKGTAYYAYGTRPAARARRDAGDRRQPRRLGAPLAGLDRLRPLDPLAPKARQTARRPRPRTEPKLASSPPRANRPGFTETRNRRSDRSGLRTLMSALAAPIIGDHYRVTAPATVTQPRSGSRDVRV